MLIYLGFVYLSAINSGFFFKVVDRDFQSFNIRGLYEVNSDWLISCSTKRHIGTDSCASDLWCFTASNDSYRYQLQWEVVKVIFTPCAYFSFTFRSIEISLYWPYWIRELFTVKLQRFHRSTAFRRGKFSRGRKKAKRQFYDAANGASV